MCVCICVYVYVCMCVCVCAFVHLRLRARVKMDVRMRARLPAWHGMHAVKTSACMLTRRFDGTRHRTAYRGRRAEIRAHRRRCRHRTSGTGRRVLFPRGFPQDDGISCKECGGACHTLFPAMRQRIHAHTRMLLQPCTCVVHACAARHASISPAHGRDGACMCARARAADERTHAGGQQSVAAAAHTLSSTHG